MWELIRPIICGEEYGLWTTAKLGREKKTSLEERGRKRKTSILVAVYQAESFSPSLKHVDTPKNHQTLNVS